MSQPVSKGFRRRNFYIDKDFQSKFVMKFCALVAGGAGFTILALYLLTQVSTTVSIVKSRVVVMTTADFLLPLLVQTVVVVTIAVGITTAVFTLIVSHKIAGPLYRFKQCFKELSQGNFSNQVRLRKDDQLHEVATEFNQMINAVRNQIQAANQATQSIKNDLDGIGEFNVEDQKRHKFNEIKFKIQELEGALRFFKDLMRKNFFILIFISIWIALLVCGTAWAGPSIDDGFGSAKKVESRYFTVFIAPGVDEGLLLQRLDIGPDHKIFAGQSLKGETFSSASLGDLLDALFSWSCGVLDMNLFSYRGNIKIAKGSDQLKDVYRKLYGVEGRDQKAFYIYEVNTLYIAEENFTKEILGHEIAHAVTSNFFVVQPPEKVAEVLSGYIEFQLRKLSKR